MSIQIHTYPQGQQLSDGELVQRQVVQAGRLVFKDAYFAELSDGDKYIIPEQAELPMATDTEILDFMLDSDIGYSRTSSWVGLWNREDSSDIAELTFDPSETDVRSVFRELMSEVIHNQTL